MLEIIRWQKPAPPVCNECGAEFSKWRGQCTECNAWNSLSEIVLEAAAARRRPRGGPAGPGRSTPTALKDVEQTEHRSPPASREFDRVLGGGLVEGAVLGGDPGIGKSTLLLQAVAKRGRTAGAVRHR